MKEALLGNFVHGRVDIGAGLFMKHHLTHIGPSAILRDTSKDMLKQHRHVWASNYTFGVLEPPGGVQEGLLGASDGVPGDLMVWGLVLEPL